MNLPVVSEDIRSLEFFLLWIMASAFGVYTDSMQQTVKSRRQLAMFLIVGALAGFLLGGGWELFFNFDEWRYSTFYRSDHDDGLLLLLQWFWYGPALWTSCGLGAGLGLWLAIGRPRGKADSR